MGSKKHKKHHRSEKKEPKDGTKPERQEKPLKLVLKVGGSSSSVQAPGSPSLQAQSEGQSSTNKPVRNDIAQSSMHAGPAAIATASHSFYDPQLQLKEEKPDTGELHHTSSHEKHKKSKKKKKKKSSERDRDKHQKRHKHHHHHHHHREHSHERKEKRRREHDHDHGAKEPPTKRQLVEQIGIPSGDRPIRDPRTCTLKKKTSKTPLQMLLCYLLKNFQKKDPQHFFAWPVSDIIAPGYSSIIPNPMDFSTMKQKIDAKDYANLSDFKLDLKLMCDNAMIYNRPDTIYYKAAKKMWHGQKLFNKEQLISLSRNLPFILDMAEEEVGFDPKEHIEEVVQMQDERNSCDLPLPSPEAKKSKHKSSKHLDEKSFPQELFDEDEDSVLDEILVQAQKAAKSAAEKLTLKKPNSKYAFLRQSDDGTTTLSILNPDRPKTEEVDVNLEMLVGKLNHGAGSISGFKEDPKNVVKPVKSLNYGSFSSYAPQYDSMFSNLTKDESCLVLSTYGDELGVQYAESLLSFAKDCDYVMNMVDSMLDALTGGTHSKTIKQLEERRKLAKDQCAKKEITSQQENSVDISLSDLDMDFLNSSDEDPKTALSKICLQQKLDKTSGLLQDLAKVQNERLSATPPSHLSNIQKANASEIELADKVTRSLTELAIQATPGAVVGLQTIRKAIGISFNSVESGHSPIASLEHHSDVSNHSSSPIIIVQKRTMEGGGGGGDTTSLMEEKNHPKSESMECDLQEFLESSSILQSCD